MFCCSVLCSAPQPIKRHICGILKIQLTICTLPTQILCMNPRGPEIEKFQDPPPALKVPSEIENLKRAIHQGATSSKLSRPYPCSVDLAAKLPNSDLNFFCRGFLGWIFFLLFFQGKRPQKIHQKNPLPELCLEKFPSDFCRSLS